MLTGESAAACSRAPGDARAGRLASTATAPLVVRVRAAGEATRLASVLRLVERAASERPASRGSPIACAAWFVGALAAAGAGTALVWWQIDPARALPVTVALLVVSCPCALSLATPAALAAAAGSLARARRRARAKRCARNAGARHARRARQDRDADRRPRPAGRRARRPAGHRARDAIALAAARRRALGTSAGARAAGCAPRRPRRRRRPAVSEFLQTARAKASRAASAESRVRVGRPDFVATLAGPMPAVAAGVRRRRGHRGALAALGDEHGWRALFALRRHAASGRRAPDRGTARAWASRPSCCPAIAARASTPSPRSLGHCGCARRPHAGRQARRDRRAAGAGRGRRDDGRRNQRRAGAGAGAGVDQPWHGDAARAAHGRRGDSFRPRRTSRRRRCARRGARWR